LLEELLSDENRVAAVELKEYLTGGFGNPTRIDYGTGHELSFAAFLCCLFKLRILTEEDYEATVFSVFKGSVIISQIHQEPDSCFVPVT
jgi:serine/threonine-protein phosphatase 2A activator